LLPSHRRHCRRMDMPLVIRFLASRADLVDIGR
jgi:hypothetical protein